MAYKINQLIPFEFIHHPQNIHRLEDLGMWASYNPGLPAHRSLGIVERSCYSLHPGLLIFSPLRGWVYGYENSY